MKFTIGRKIWALSLAVFLFVGMASFCVYWQVRDALAWQKMVIEVKWPVAQSVSDAFASMNLSRMVVRDAILDQGDPAKLSADIERYQKAVIDFDASIEKLVALAKGFQKEDNRERVRTVAANLPAVHNAERLALEAARNGDAKGALAAMRTVLPQVNIVRQMLTELQTQNNTLTATVFKTIESDMNTCVLWLLGCFAAVLALGSVISWRVARQVSRSAAELCLRAQEIAAGDLSGLPLSSHGQDEFADLAASMNQMQQQLQQLLLKISATSSELAGASERISQTSAHGVETSRQQTDQTNMVATAIHQMSATVAEVTGHSQAAATAAASASATAQEGGALVRHTLEVMNRISGSNQKIAERVTKLGESSQQVGKIASVIDDIADQTNLLALNAAIEAARAGEQGRGFAVVADEVRKLAERTAAATREIAQILDVVLAESRNTAQAMNQGKQDVEAGVAGSRQAGEALERIIGMATKVGDMVTQIATAATEQSSATDEIQNSAQRIAEMATDSSDAANKSASACEQLSSLALRLQEIVGFFRVSGGARTAHAAVLQPPPPAAWSSQYSQNR
jgi:methyl-accepting chemotaxis protein